VIDSLYVVWKYVRYNRWKTIVLVACIALITSLPLALQIVVDESERQLMARATDSPLIVGAKGSALDLVMNTLYFASRPPDEIRMGETARIDESGLALPIPVFVRFEARGSPIVGTTLDYFDFRDLRTREGRSLAILGDCVLGASVAKRLRLGPGDSLVSSPENLFDLAGAYPLKMNVVGVLEPSHTPDERIESLVSGGRERPLLAPHPVYSYLARRNGLNLENVMWEASEVPGEQAWTDLEARLRDRPAGWMIWEAEPAAESVRRLESLGVRSLVFDPLGNRPAQGDFMSAMERDVGNLEAAFR
jgi:hypothetical protein